MIATDIRGCRQVVARSETGLLFPKGDVEALTGAIIEIGSDADRRRRMGQAAAMKAAREFDEKNVVDIVMDTYERLARARGLGWSTLEDTPRPQIRAARVGDRKAIAELHKGSIGSGFLSTLGAGFLALLYRALIESDEAAVFVVESEGVVVGFIAGTVDTSAFYKTFVRHHGVEAAVRLASLALSPSVARRAYETLRYGSEQPRAAAELLSMAVAPVARRRGMGRRLVERLLEWARDEGISAMTVVVGADNVGAIGLYNECGFVDGREIEVHEGSPSKEFLWTLE